jgi:hypothetical protein
MITTLQLDWIKKINPNYRETLKDDEEIMWDTLWNFDECEWSEENAKTVRNCGMIPVEVDGLIFCALSGCGMDLMPIVIYTQLKLTGAIEYDEAMYIKNKSRNYVEAVIGKKHREELLNYINKHFDI